MKKKYISFVNFSLFFLIILIWSYFLYKKTIYFHIDGENAQKIVSFLEKEFHVSIDNKLVIFIVFNTLPFSSELEDIDKIALKRIRSIKIMVFFVKLLRFPFKPSFKFITDPHLRLFAIKKDEKFRKRYFLIIKNSKVIYIGKGIININDIVHLIKISSSVSSYSINGSNEMEGYLKETLKREELFLYNLKTNSYRNISNLSFKEICFIPYICPNKKYEKLLNTNMGHRIFIFPVFVNSYKVKKFLSELGSISYAYFDRKDELNLLFVNILSREPLCFKGEQGKNENY